MITIREEQMRTGFEKFHLEGLPFGAVLHKFSVTDNGVIHDHPFAFTTHILKGSYVERVYRMMPWGQIAQYLVHRTVGTSHRVEASCIHELTELPEGECWTLIVPEAWEREPGFWRFDEKGGWFRQHNREDFQLLMPSGK